MSLPLESSTWTYTLTNDSFEVPSGLVKSISIFNGTATAGSVIGTATLAGIESTAISLVQNKSFNMTASEGANTIGGLTITAPSGCTLDIVCEL